VGGGSPVFSCTRASASKIKHTSYTRIAQHSHDLSCPCPPPFIHCSMHMLKTKLFFKRGFCLRPQPPIFCTTTFHRRPSSSPPRTALCAPCPSVYPPRAPSSPSLHDNSATCIHIRYLFFHTHLRPRILHCCPFLHPKNNKQHAMCWCVHTPAYKIICKQEKSVLFCLVRRHSGVYFFFASLKNYFRMDRLRMGINTFILQKYNLINYRLKSSTLHTAQKKDDLTPLPHQKSSPPLQIRKPHGTVCVAMSLTHPFLVAWRCRTAVCFSVMTRAHIFVGGLGLALELNAALPFRATASRCGQATF
jgi:hypothetical protein